MVSYEAKLAVFLNRPTVGAAAMHMVPARSPIYSAGGMKAHHHGTMRRVVWQPILPMLGSNQLMKLVDKPG